jgi:hypothetical protein
MENLVAVQGDTKIEEFINFLILLKVCMNSELQQKIDEISSYILGYEDVVRSIVTKVYENGCCINTWNKKISLHNWEPESSCIIWLGIDKVDTKHMMWDLLHEFGHHLDGRKSADYKDNDFIEQMREINAWKNADQEFSLYSILQKDYENYLDYKTKCLKTYNLTLEDLND